MCKYFNQKYIIFLIIAAVCLPIFVNANEPPPTHGDTDDAGRIEDTVWSGAEARGEATNGGGFWKSAIEGGKQILRGATGDLTGNAIAGAADFLSFGLGEIIAWISGFTFMALGLILSFVGVIYDAIFYVEIYTKAPLVIEGWKIVLGFTNMFFAVILVVIAFATIIGNATYGMKNLLRNFIFAAIIINFSLVISGAIIDVSQIFVHYFVDDMKNSNESFSVALASKMHIQNLVKVDMEKGIFNADTSGLTLKNLSFNVLTPLMNAIMGSVFLIMAIFAFAGGIVLLLTRMLKLWGLIIFSPLAWAASILPRTKPYFSEWWKEFIDACTVGPVYVFFVYLAIRFIKEGAIEKMLEGARQAGPFADAVQFALQYSILCGILFMGFIVAPKLGDKSADIVLNQAQALRKGAQNWAKGKAIGAATEAGRGITRSGAYQGVANWMAGKPLIGRLGTQMQLGREALTEKTKKEIEARGNKYAGLDAKQQANAFKTGTWKDKIGILDNLSKDPDKLAASGLTPQQITDTLNMAKQKGVLNKDTKLRNLEYLDEKDIEDTLSKIKHDDFGKIGGNIFDPATKVGAAMQKELNKVDAATGKHNGNIGAEHLISYAKTNPTDSPKVRDFLANNAIHGDVQKNIMNNAGKAHLGIGKTREEIVDRETEKEMNNPTVQAEINKEIDDERLADLKNHASYNRLADTTAGPLASQAQRNAINAAKAANEKLREDMDLEKIAGDSGTNVSTYLANEARRTGKTVAQIETEARANATRQDKHNRREAKKSLKRTAVETNLSRDAAAATPPPAGSAARQYRDAFQFHS